MQFMLGRKKCILKYKDNKNLLKKINELISKCRHRNRFKMIRNNSTILALMHKLDE